jgi:hypothetical protein
VGGGLDARRLAIWVQLSVSVKNKVKILRFAAAASRCRHFRDRDCDVFIDGQQCAASLRPVDPKGERVVFPDGPLGGHLMGLFQRNTSSIV